jgi:hypothetical protein
LQDEVFDRTATGAHTARGDLVGRGGSGLRDGRGGPVDGEDAAGNEPRCDRSCHRAGPVNAHEGDRHVRVLAAARALPFRSGRASCVIDTYRTSRAPYREIACLVQGAHRSTVIVGAATTDAWPRERAQLERAVQAFRT